MTFTEALVSVARREWIRWGGPIETIEGDLIGFTDPRMEAVFPYWTYVGEYWQTIGSHLDGRDDPAWSAAFISYCFNQAAAGKRFPYHENHSVYVSKIDSGKYTGLVLEDPAHSKITIGDLLWASRGGDGCRTPPLTFADAKAELGRMRKKTADTFCSHSDIVVDIRDGAVDVIGGNVKQSVTRTTYHLDADGKIKDGRRVFIGVIKNSLS